jgi:PAS domain S-box-containing protein
VIATNAPDIVSDPISFLRAVLASSGDCIKILDLDGNLIFMTEAGQRVMEVADFGAIQGCPWPDFWRGQGNTDAKAAMETARQGKMGHFQGFATTMAGTPKWWDVTVTLIRDADGHPDKLLSISRDITQARGADEALRESEGRFKTFAQAMPNQVWSGTPDGLLDWVNDQVLAYTGMKPEDLTGNKWAAIVHPEDIGSAAARWAAAVESGAPYQTEFRVRRADQSYRWHLARALPIKDDAGHITRWIGTNTDIEEQKQAEAQQQLLTRELEHRMKNMMAMVAAIATQTFRTAATKEEARTIFDARLQTLNNAHNILTQTSWTTAPMKVVVEGALAAHRSGERRIRISGPDIELSAKKALSLALALHELATNAVKYGALSTPHGTVDIAWYLAGPLGDQILGFCWRETGGPLVSAPSHRGFGSRLIESTLSSDFGNSTIDFQPSGVICSFETKLVDLAGNEIIEMANSHPPASRAVLIVEDEALLRLHAVDMVEKAGFTAIEAVNADEALTILHDRSDIVALFTDIRMPGTLDGLELAHAVRKEWPPIKIVIVSGHMPPHEIDMPIDSRFFRKPFDAKRMVSELREMIES